MSLHSNWSCIEEIPTRLDSKEEEIIEIEDEDENKDYEPPEPIYQIQGLNLGLNHRLREKQEGAQIYLQTVSIPEECSVLAPSPGVEDLDQEDPS